MTINVPKSVLDAIAHVVGDRGWITAADDMAPYLQEQRRLYTGVCAMIVRPATTAQTAEVVRLSAEANIPITPQGGNTGLVGGAVGEGGIILATDRLKRIRDIDIINHTMIVEAGCVLTDIRSAATTAGAMFPLSLGAEGSCQIGGNISTNAGGAAVLRYGNMRDLVLGLEVVLADGRVWHGLSNLRKDNSGYDLKQLFIGAEGTLGIITAAVLKLFPVMAVRETIFAAMPDVNAALELFIRIRDKAGDSLGAFEIMSRTSVELALKHGNDCRDPLAARHPWYVIAERQGMSPNTNLQNILATAMQDGVVSDATIAASESQSDALWRIRESIPQAQRNEGASIKHDVSLALSKIGEFIKTATHMVEDELQGVRVVAFGHLGDGNIHFNLSQPINGDGEEFISHRQRINDLVHELVVKMGGSFSAEHGIGKLKIKDMERFKQDVELDIMRTIKRGIDPHNIMNPGKVLKP